MEFRPSINNRNEDELIDKIQKELIGTNDYEDIQRGLESRARWKLIADITEALGVMIAGIGTILAFASGFFKLEILAFLAGCAGVVSMVFIKYSAYALNECRERTMQVNMVLDKLGMAKIVDLTNGVTPYSLMRFRLKKNSDTDNTSPREPEIESDHV